MGCVPFSLLNLEVVIAGPRRVIVDFSEGLRHQDLGFHEALEVVLEDDLRETMVLVEARLQQFWIDG